MQRVKLAVLLGSLAIAASGVVASDDGASGQKSESSSSTKVVCSPVSCSEFSQAVDAWRLANLAGDNNLAKECEQKVLSLIDRDLKFCADILNEGDNSKSGSSHESAKGASTSPTSEAAQDDENTYAWQMFGAKKRIAWNIRHTEAFSNKYRLFGDYEDLIKREKSADRAGVPLDMQEKGGQPTARGSN